MNTFGLSILSIVALMVGLLAISTWSLNQQAHNAQMQLIEIQKLKQCKTN